MNVAGGFMIVASLLGQPEPQSGTRSDGHVTALRGEIGVTAPPGSLLSSRAGLAVEGATIQEALTLLSEASGVSIAFSPNFLPSGRRIRCHCEDLDIASTLDRLLAGTGFGYVELDDQVVISRRKEGDLVRPGPSVVGPTFVLPVVATSLAAPSTRRLAQAREGTLTGLVVEERSGRPLAGAQISIPGTGLGTLSTSEGRYLLPNVPAGEVTVEARLIGYGTVRQTTQVSAGGTAVLNFELRQEVLALDAVIVTGTPGGTQRRAIGNVVDRLDASEIQEVVHTQNVQQLLGQRSAGVMQLGQTGAPGAGFGLRVRGMSSIGLPNAPIVYLDGVRIDAEPRHSGSVHYGVPRNRLNTLNPGDIQSVEIIKGPAAATLYGTEASGGVIQILTHRGATGAASFDFTASLGTSWMWDPAKRTGTSWSIMPETGEIASANIYELEAREGLGPIFGHGRLQSYQATARGGSESIRYFVAGSWSDEKGIVGYEYDKRFSGRVNLELIPTENLTVGARLGYVQGETREVSRSFQNCPICQLDWGAPRFIPTTRGFLGSPPEAWETVEARADVDRTTVSFEANYTPTQWLKQRLIAGFDVNQEHNWILWPRQPEGLGHYFGTAGLGSKSAERGRRSNLTLDYAGSADFRLSGRLSSTTSFGLQYFKSINERVGGNADEFPAIPITTLGGGAVSSALEDWVENATVGVYGQQQFDWQNRVFVTGAVRADDNSAFGEEFDAAIYPKFSATWIMSEEPFWNVSWLEAFRLRGAWGAAGRQPGTFDAARLFRPAVGYLDEPSLEPQAFGNPQLRPERATELEVGFDASLFDGRLQLVYTRYDRHTRDLIVPRGLPASLGFPGAQIVNLGEVKGWGNEFSMTGEVVRRPGFNFTLGAQLTTQDNRILDLGDLEGVAGGGLLQNRVGYSIGDLYMLKVLDAELDDEGALISALCDGGTGPYGVDMGGPAVPCEEADRVRWGSTEPKWLLGVDATANLFERLSLYARVDAAGGHVQRGGRFLAAHADFVTTEASVLQNDPQNNIFQAYRVLERSSLTFVKMGFARLREVSATYSLPSPWAAKVGASRGSVSLGARNLLMLWTAADGWDIRGESSVHTDQPGGAWMWDPELRMPADTGDGVQATQMPATASMTLTVRLGF